MNEEDNVKLASGIKKLFTKIGELVIFWLIIYGFIELRLFEIFDTKYFEVREDWFISGIIIASIFIVTQDVIYSFFGWYKKYSK